MDINEFNFRLNGTFHFQNCRHNVLQTPYLSNNISGHIRNGSDLVGYWFSRILTPRKRNEETKYNNAGVMAATALFKLACSHCIVAAHQEREQFIPNQTEVTIRAD